MKCVDPCVTKTVTLNGKTYLLNDKNYLRQFTEWDEHIRDWLAAAEKLELQEQHLHVLDFLRGLFAERKKHPVVRMVTTEMSARFGAENGTLKRFHTLFPGGLHQAFLIAGLPMQDSCC